MAAGRGVCREECPVDSVDDGRAIGIESNRSFVMPAVFLLSLFFQAVPTSPAPAPSAFVCVGEKDAARVVLDRDPCALQPAGGTAIPASDRERWLIAFDRSRSQFAFGRIAKDQSVPDVSDAQQSRGSIALTVDTAACPAADEFPVALAQPGTAKKWLLQLDRGATNRAEEEDGTDQPREDRDARSADSARHAATNGARRQPRQRKRRRGSDRRAAG